MRSLHNISRHNPKLGPAQVLSAMGCGWYWWEGVLVGVKSILHGERG